ncbi:hypothetical protein CANARDRAFT_28212 [[Candida] arabinofermentans NRRL YB-2248]|uniref:Uncharacterized protein n=1 Tax=[Candida] arabinofermentans NRRL YB-2248 TaxID=983967 RepID=A0A1E4T0Y5_9ASCO|nr:hypothetical protein CANARDRAFT_28212 [[Candida] arabinofermentans NRRL YB-2248]
MTASKNAVAIRRCYLQYNAMVQSYHKLVSIGAWYGSVSVRALHDSSKRMLNTSLKTPYEALIFVKNLSEDSFVMTVLNVS